MVNFVERVDVYAGWEPQPEPKPAPAPTPTPTPEPSKRPWYLWEDED